MEILRVSSCREIGAFGVVGVVVVVAIVVWMVWQNRGWIFSREERDE